MSTTTTTFRGPGLAPGLKFFTKEYEYADILALFTTAPELVPVKAGHALVVQWQNMQVIPGSVAFNFDVMSGDWTLGSLVDLPGKFNMNQATSITSEVRNYGENAGLLNDDPTKNIAWSVSGTAITQGNGKLIVSFGYKYLPLPMSAGQTV
tara:strand:+ start:60 stop:512 length:453 start_codon:yes stop_codon:yes gene_type:complete